MGGALPLFEGFSTTAACEASPFGDGAQLLGGHGQNLRDAGCLVIEVVEVLASVVILNRVGGLFRILGLLISRLLDVGKLRWLWQVLVILVVVVRLRDPCLVAALGLVVAFAVVLGATFVLALVALSATELAVALTAGCLLVRWAIA